MPKIQSIDTSNQFRILLSEILPHEVPPRFSLDRIFERLSKNKLNALDKYLLQPDKTLAKTGDTIPYAFSIQRGHRKNRELHVMHPVHILQVVGFYNSFDAQILANCQKSQWTLRAPSGIAKRTKVSRTVEILTDTQSQKRRLPRSSNYFTYRPSGLLYHFFESEDFHRLESRFRYMKSIDVQSCFDNIYTHSIAWAVRDKNLSKASSYKTAKYTFEAAFDRLMRSMNYGETNGILVGPELSRLFAENILQFVDASVEKELEGEIAYGKDYEARRYLDDFFIFYNDQPIADRVEGGIRSHLKRCKLHINDAKTKQTASPFLSNLSGAKIDLRSIIDGLFSRIWSQPADGSQLPSSLFPTTFQNIKRTIAQWGCNYNECVSYCLSILQSKIARSDCRVRRLMVLGGVLSLVCRLLELDFRYQVAIKTATIFKLFQKSQDAGFRSDPHQTDVDLEIADQVSRIAANALSRASLPSLSLLTILIASARNANVHRANPRLARTIWETMQKTSSESFDYFTAISLLYFCWDRGEYSDLVSEILASSENFLSASVSSCPRADHAMLAADLICCPLIAHSGKVRIAKLLKETPHGNQLSDQVASKVKGSSMFFDWGKEVSTTQYLLRKQLSMSYT